jgi:N-acetylmuramoyl-L-alanine amidase
MWMIMLKLLIALLSIAFILSGYSHIQIDKNEQKLSQIKPTLLSSQDIKLLVQLVNAEGMTEPYIGKVAIASVVLNRLKNNNFPKSVSGIIFEPGQFSSVGDGKFWLVVSDDTARKAVMDAINGVDPTEGSLYYYNPDKPTSSTTCSPVKEIGVNIFCK